MSRTCWYSKSSSPRNASDLRIVFVRKDAPLPPGIGLFGGGGAAQVRTFDQGNARYRLEVFVAAENLTNPANYLGYSGVMTSPFFGFSSLRSRVQFSHRGGCPAVPPTMLWAYGFANGIAPHPYSLLLRR